MKYHEPCGVYKSDEVAPFTGAWIEIKKKGHHNRKKIPSHPSRVRGLKWLIHFELDLLAEVAPFTGAWIEIWMLLQEILHRFGSHPSRVRGLKSP